MISKYMINGKLVPVDQAMVRIQDLGLLRGYGIFDFFPLMHGQLVFIDDYFNRFFSSAEKMELQPPVSRAELMQAIYELVLVNGQQDGYIRLVLTGGDAPDGFSPVRNNLYIMQYMPIYYDQSMFENGAKLTLQRFRRERPDVKTLNYANPLRHRDQIERVGALDVLYHDGRYIHETSRANFFLVNEDGRLHTTPHTVLGGITRLHVLSVASRHYTVVEKPMALDDLLRAKEAFITSTTKGVLPVTIIDQLMIGHGRPGPVTKKLAGLFSQYVSDHVNALVEANIE